MANANTTLTVSTLDFDEIQQSLKNFLKAKPQFNQVDFDGSNMSALIDVLAYNTYLNSFYLNMVASEMFIDSAQLRDSVISHAKSLNYLPRSFRSSYAVVDITVTPTNNSVVSVRIPQGTEFVSRVESNTYVFSTSEDIVLTTPVGSAFTANTVFLYEGQYTEDVYVFDAANSSQRFVLSNPNIDTNSLFVFVSENSGANVYRYEVRSSLFDVSANTAMCFIQAAENDKYEIVFGNGIAGRPPTDGALILTRYQVSSGELPNGASVFVPTSNIDGHANVIVTTRSVASGGDIYESVESIKFNAPRFYQTQERAVTANDYRVMLQVTYPEITAINVYGGEDADPPRYGTVVISAIVAGSGLIPEYKKQEYTEYIKRRASLSSDPVFIEPTFMGIDVDVDIKYNTGSTVKTAQDIEAAVRAAITRYSSTNLEDFSAVLRYSALTRAIDIADPSIISNDLYAKPFLHFIPVLNQRQTHTLNFYNEFRRMPHSDRVHIYEDEHTIRTTPFTYNGTICTIEDDGDGKLRIVQVSGTNHLVVEEDIGSVDYITGTVIIRNLRVSAYDGNRIKVYALTLQKDISAIRNQVIRIDANDVGVNVTAERIL
jgi:hypothetical protein